MRRAGLDVLPAAARLARDPDVAVRREVALSLRDVPAERALPFLVDLARAYDGQDRSYLEAWGTGATGKEADLYPRVKALLAPDADATSWSPAFARLAWRLHVPAAVPDLLARAKSAKLSLADRKLALDTIAFIDDPSASQAMLALAGPDSALKEPATWWLLNRMPRPRATGSASSAATLRSPAIIRSRTAGVWTFDSSKRKALMMCCCSTVVWLFQNRRACV